MIDTEQSSLVLGRLARFCHKRRVVWLTLLAVLAASSLGCSVRRKAVSLLGNALAEGGATFAADDDPDLIRDALPFTLKTLEVLLAEVPDHPGLLMAACQGFTQYAGAFIELDILRAEAVDYQLWSDLKVRARRLYLRSRGYCLRALDEQIPSTSQALIRDPEAAVTGFSKEHAELLFWAGAAWGSAIAQGLDQPELVADTPAAKALLERAFELDPDHDRGAFHEAMITLESVEIMGGSHERARQHFERAVALSGGRRASPYVAFAEKVAVAQQNRQEFERLLEAALALDPDSVANEDRLSTLVSQRRARLLLDQIDDLFFEGSDDLGELGDTNGI